MYCLHCRNEIPDNANFCSHCGAAVIQPVTEDTVEVETVVPGASICPKCGQELNQDAAFCCRCGVSLGLPFQEQGYLFKEIDVRNKSVMSVLRGKEIVFKPTEHYLAVIQDAEVQKKITAIPYNEIDSFEMKEHFSVLFLLLGLFSLASGIVPLVLIFCNGLFEGSEEAVFIVLSLVLLGLAFLYVLPVREKVRIRMIYGKKIELSLIRIRKHTVPYKQEFLNDLNARINNTEKLAGVTKENSRLFIGYTKVNAASVLHQVVSESIDRV